MSLLDLLEFRRLIVKFGGSSRSAEFCFHKLKNVSKAGVHVRTEIKLFKALLIIADNVRSYS